MHSTGIRFCLNFHPRSRSNISYLRKINWLPANDDRVKYCIANTLLLVSMKLILKKVNIFPRTVFNIIGNLFHMKGFYVMMKIHNENKNLD